MTRILVVDDEADLLELARIALEIDGHEVLVAASAEEALTVLEREHVEVVLLDLRLPGMGGRELLEHLRETGWLDKLKVIAVSAHASEATRREVEAAGAVGYVVKPFTLGSLRDAVADSMSGADGG